MDSDNRDILPDDLQRILFEHASDAMFVLSEQGALITVNQTACDYLGYSKEELLQNPPQMVVAPEYAAGFPERIRRLQEEGHCTFEMEHVHRNGTRIPVEMHSRLISHDGGNVILTICRDISLRKQRELEYRSIIQAAGDGYWAVRASDARIIDVNDTFCRMVGYDRQELLTMTISDLEAVESPEETAAHIQKIITTGHDLFETRHRHKDGRILDFEISVSHAGGVFHVFTRDISARKQQEAEASLAAMIFNASTASIMATDADNRIVSANPAFTRTSGYALHEVIGKNPRLLQSGRQDKTFYQQMWQTLQATGHWEGEWWNRRKDGEEYAEQVALNVVRNRDGSVYRYVKISSDITEKKKLDDLIWRQAHYDSITNLPNRRLFHSQLVNEITRCRGSGQYLALYFIDLDGFKEINDTFGHDAGDQLLMQTAQRIARCVRGSDTVARLGGDEFTVMLSGLSELARVQAVGQEILAALNQPFALGSAVARISASIGIALFPEHAANAEQLMKRADQAMYVAKGGGKNTVCYCSAG